jgi:hypothetical protein
MQYWWNRGFELSGTPQEGVLLASNPRKRQYLLVKLDWFTDEYRQHTPILHSEHEALTALQNLAAA